MDQKPSAKAIISINLINNIPMAVVMSIMAPILIGEKVFTLNLLVNIVIAFILACIINLVLPIPIIAQGVPKLFKMDPQGFGGRIVANVPICFVFVLLIGLILTLYNVRAVPDFIFAFMATFLPLYIVCFIISMITNPIAMKVAMGK